MQGPLNATHVVQPGLLVRDMDEALDRLHALFGMYPSERVDIANTGVNNAVYALENMTFLELIEPYDQASAAYRLLERGGEGWHMLSVDIAPEEPAAVDQALERAGVRVVHRNRTDAIAGAWHLHPRDCGGVLLNLAIRSDANDNSAWAGPAWREYVGSNTRVVRSVLGISIATERPLEVAALYETLGFRFGGPDEEEGDEVRTAHLAGGTFIQVRSPAATDAFCGPHLERHGEGLFHLVLAVSDRDVLTRRLERTSTGFRPFGGGGAVVTNPPDTFGVPIELR